MPAPITPAQRRARLEALWIEREWRKCANDVRYWIENYYYVPLEFDTTGAGRTKTLFKLYEYQADLLQTFRGKRHVAALKSRQMGFTSLAMADSLHLLLFRPGSNILVVSRGQVSADKNLGMAKQAYQFLPEWMKERGPRIDGDAAKQMRFVFPDGTASLMRSAPATRTVFAGETATRVIADEVGLWDEDKAGLSEDAMRSLEPTTLAGGSIFLISTARGAFNYFARTYRYGKRGQNQYTAVFEPWHKNPLMQCTTSPDCICPDATPGRPCQASYDIKLQAQIIKGTPWLHYSEYPATDEEAFRQSGASRFSNLPPADEFTEFAIRGNLEEDENGKIVFKKDLDGFLYLAADLSEYEGHSFVIGADHSLGKGQDFSVAQVLTVDAIGRPEIVAHMETNTTEPFDWATHLNRLGHFFSGPDGRPALLAPENQHNEGGGGKTVVQRLWDLNYSNLYYFRQPASRNRKAMNHPGFAFVQGMRDSVINGLAPLLTPDPTGELPLAGIHIKLREELGTFVVRQVMTPGGKQTSKVGADTGTHDDQVMALAIAVYVAQEQNLLPATSVVTKQEDPEVQVFSVASVFDDARKAAKKTASTNRKWAQQINRQARRNRKRS